mmetsp:Transcript_23699/g.81395  ORF Transcript_23699/g.81395 Transcript_23699/m.81395 type:complete len:294 (-) Transcript_23699:21-902(-)
MATCRVSNSLGRASRALLLLAAATTALAPQRSLPVRCASRSRSRVVVFADDDVETLRDQAAKLRAEVEVLQAEAAKERAEELKRNPPPPEPEKKAEAPEKKAVAALETDDDAGFSFPNPFGGGDDAQPKRAVSSDEDVAALLRVAACAPYLLPLSDVIPFSQYIANDFPIVLLPLAPFAPFVALLNVIPFGSFIVFLGLSSASRNPELPRFVRFSMQQAVLLDIALIFPQLFQQLFGGLKVQFPQELVEPSASFVFLFIAVSILYSCGSNALGKQPNQIPIISNAAEQSIGPF